MFFRSLASVFRYPLQNEKNFSFGDEVKNYQRCQSNGVANKKALCRTHRKRNSIV